LKKTLDGMSSGRGRLNELSSLQAELAKKEEEFEEEKQQYEDQLKSMSQELEALAESNQQLMAALEGDSEKLTEVGSKMDSKRCCCLVFFCFLIDLFFLDWRVN
jgi:predicted nuclease with TOPRIM domain